MEPQELKNLYEVRKTVRFELVPQFENSPKPKKSKNLNDEINIFIESYEKIISNFDKIAFKGYDKDKLNSKLKVKFSWLKTYTKQEFYEIKEKIIKYNKKGSKDSNQVELSKKEMPFLLEKFQNWIEVNKELIVNIKDLWKRPEENKSRKSDLGYYFHQIIKRSNFEFISELFNENFNSENPVTSELIEKTKILTKEVFKLLEMIEKTLLPSQSMGQVIEKASFNYYTVNKKPKDYEENIKNLFNDFNKPLFNYTFFNKKEQKLEELFKYKLIEEGFNNFISILGNDLFIERYGKTEKKFFYLKIENAYKLMKEYKAEQKSAFLQFLSKGFIFDDLGKHNEFDYHITKEEKKKIKIFLFDDVSENNFNFIVNLSKEILDLSTEKSVLDKAKDKKEINDLTEKITDLKKLRGTYFDVQNNTCVFTKYKNFCQEYKKVAMEFGKIKALIKSLEKEKIDAEKTNSWSLILQKDNQKYLLTIPRETNEKLEGLETNLNKAKTFIDPFLKDEGKDWAVYKFESLTLRALDKLCFGKENNTFRPKIKSDIETRYKHFLNDKGRIKDKFEFKKYKEDKELDKKLLLDFYQTVLSLNSTKEQIIIDHYKDFDTFVSGKYDSLDEFETELKKTCYIKESFSISSETKEQVINDFNAKLYKITSYDLQKYDKEVLEKLENKKELDRGNPENLTKLWLEFWTEENNANKYPIRLNPEIKISFIEKDEDFKEKKEGKIFQNRKFLDRYLLTSTITQNALNKEINLNYKDKDEIIKTYENYNDDFNKSLKQNEIKYFYGLDRGENELVSLGLFDLSKEKNEEKGVSIEALELEQDYFLKTDEKGRIAYKNLSYFLDKKEFFKERTIISCFDLTSSKLIKDKIVLNGDISSFLKLKEISAKRKIYEMISKSENKSEMIIFTDDNRKIVINGNETKNEVLYYFDERYLEIISRDMIKEKLQDYLFKVKANLSDNDEISIEKVNNLRDAICANMVGIITYLQTKYPGMMFFEDWNIKGKDDRVKNNSFNLISRIEFKLLQKFSSLNLVPPTYKQVMSLQSEKIIKQLGIIGYIKTEGTSSDCPNCEAKKGGYIENEFNKLKFEDHKYLCNKCLFDSSNESKRKGLIGLDNPDSVATYNIAKKGKSNP